MVLNDNCLGIPCLSMDLGGVNTLAMGSGHLVLAKCGPLSEELGTRNSLAVANRHRLGVDNGYGVALGPNQSLRSF